jgi:hypothetical protein
METPELRNGVVTLRLPLVFPNRYTFPFDGGFPMWDLFAVWLYLKPVRNNS